MAARLIEAGLLALIGAWCIAASAGCGRGLEPTVENETAESRRADIAKSFTRELGDDGGEHAQSLRAFFDDFQGVIATGSAFDLPDVFDLRMTVSLLEQQDLLPMAIPHQDDFYQGMYRSLADQFTSPVSGLRWERVEIKRARFLQDETEAVVYTQTWGLDGNASKMRWWLIRDEGNWRAYDYESLELAVRFSDLLAVGFKMASQDDPAAEHILTLQQAMQHAATGDLELVLSTIESVRHVRFPPQFESIRLSIYCAALMEAGRVDEGLDAADAALAINRDQPVIHLLRAFGLLNQARLGEALAAAEEYAGQLGQDAAYFQVQGTVLAAQGQSADAAAAFRQGLADDPQSGYCVLGLLQHAPHMEGPSAMTAYRALDNPDDWFVELADVLVSEADTATLRRLIDLHRSVSPDDPNLEVYESQLGLPER